MGDAGHGSIVSHGDTCRFDGLPCSLLVYGEAKGALGFDRGTTEKGEKLRQDKKFGVDFVFSNHL